MACGTTEWVTFLFLVLFFLSAEVYHMLRRREGGLVSFCGPDIPLGDLLGTRAKIRMKDGEVVDAEMSSCTLCLGKFEVGDRVYVCKNRDKYVVSLPLFMKGQRKRNNFCKSSCRREQTSNQGL